MHYNRIALSIWLWIRNSSIVQRFLKQFRTITIVCDDSLTMTCTIYCLYKQLSSFHRIIFKSGWDWASIYCFFHSLIFLQELHWELKLKQWSWIWMYKLETEEIEWDFVYLFQAEIESRYNVSATGRQWSIRMHRRKYFWSQGLASGPTSSRTRY